MTALSVKTAFTSTTILKVGDIHLVNPKTRLDPTASFPLGQSPNAPNYIKYHLAISRMEYEKHETQGTYKNTGLSAEQQSLLSMSEVCSTNCTPEHFVRLLTKVGERYGWHKRAKYNLNDPQAHTDMTKMLHGDETRFYRFEYDDKTVGFCLVTGIERKNTYRYQRQGLDKTAILNALTDKLSTPNQASSGIGLPAIEINKIGFFPQHTGQRLGSYFLPMLMKEIFRTISPVCDRNYNTIYLDTRSTNHEKVLEFYAQQGIHVFCAEKLKNDLQKPEEDPQVIALPAQHQSTDTYVVT